MYLILENAPPHCGSKKPFSEASPPTHYKPQFGSAHFRIEAGRTQPTRGAAHGGRAAADARTAKTAAELLGPALNMARRGWQVEEHANV